jgi:hypothetical protein
MSWDKVVVMKIRRRGLFATLAAAFAAVPLVSQVDPPGDPVPPRPEPIRDYACIETSFAEAAAPYGRLRYNAVTEEFEYSHAGGAFVPLTCASSKA